METQVMTEKQFKRLLRACKSGEEREALCNVVLRQQLEKTIRRCRKTLATMDLADEHCQDPDFVPYDRGEVLVLLRDAEKKLAELEA
jgi:hypothetical protein